MRQISDEGRTRVETSTLTIPHIISRLNESITQTKFQTNDIKIYFLSASDCDLLLTNILTESVMYIYMHTYVSQTYG